MRGLANAALLRPLSCGGAAAGIILLFPRIPQALTWPARLMAALLILLAVGGLIAGIRRSPRRFAFGLVAILLGAGLAYGMLEAVSLAWLKTKHRGAHDPFQLTAIQRDSIQRMLDDTPDYNEHSPSLGWAPGVNRVSEDGLFKTNSAGFRANREYPGAKPPDKIRVICFGDSFVHGDEVGNMETWPHFAEQAQPEMEFLNFGVGGYGVTQSFVRYEENAPQYETDVVILGCMTDDTRRSLNVFYPYRFANPADAPSATAMPYAMLDDAGMLQIRPPFLSSKEDYRAFLENPRPHLKKMAALDPLFTHAPPTPLLRLLAERGDLLESALIQDGRRYVKKAAMKTLRMKETSVRQRTPQQLLRDHIFAVNTAIFDRFSKVVSANGDLPLVVWFPSVKDLDHHNSGRKRAYQNYLEYFRRNNIAHVDVLDYLIETHGAGNQLPVSTILKIGHFSASTNQMIGGRLADHVLQMTRNRQGPRGD